MASTSRAVCWRRRVNEIIVPITPGSTIHAVELYVTVDDDQELTYNWVSMSTVWTANSAPNHTFSVSYRTDDGAVEAIGTIETPGVFIQDTAGQTNHTLSYRLPVNGASPGEAIIIQMQSLDPAYGFDLGEVRVFGTAP